MNRSLQIVLLLLCWNFTMAQHKISTGAKIKEKVINASTGILLVKTSDNTQGISPKEKLPLWNNDALNKVDFESYQEIPFTPYVLFEKKPLISSKLLTKAFGAKGVSRVVLDVSSGVVLFDSEAQGFKAVSNTFLLPEQQAVLVDGIKEKELVVALFSYKTGKLLWETKLTKSKFFKRLTGALFNKEIVILDKYQNIFWLKNRNLLKINGTSGAIEYDQEDVHSIALNKSKDALYVFTKTIELEQLKNETAIFNKLTTTMEDIWSKPTTIIGTVSETVMDNENLIAITSKGFNIINTKTGKKQWDTSESLPLIKKIVPTDNGYLVVQEQFLTKVGVDGKKAWDKHQKISRSSKEIPIHIFDDNNKALYLTPSFANVVTTENGTKLWQEDVVLNDADFVSRNLKLKEHYYQTWYDDARHQFPVYNNNVFYIFDCITKTAPKPLYQFNFGRAIPKLDMYENGYFVHHNNSYYAFDTNGVLNYKKIYEPIEKDTFLDHNHILVRSWYWHVYISHRICYRANR